MLRDLPTRAKVRSERQEEMARKSITDMLLPMKEVGTAEEQPGPYW